MVPSARRPLARAPRVLAAAGALVAAACSTVLNIQADRYVANPADASAGSETDARGPADPWACVSLPGQPLDPSFEVSLTLRVMDAQDPSTSAGAVDGGSDLDTVSGTFLSGVSVKKCDLRDPTCMNGVGPVVTDDAGAASFQAAGDFAGFFDLEGKGLVPATLYAGNLLQTDTSVSFPAYTLRVSEFESLAQAVTREPPSLDPDGGLGHALVAIYDCQDHQAPGVVVSYSVAGPQQLPFYLHGGLPSITATQTDAFGLAGAINFPAGTVTATATLAGDGGPPTATAAGATLGSITFMVRPGGLTFAWIRVRSH